MDSFEPRCEYDYVKNYRRMVSRTRWHCFIIDELFNTTDKFALVNLQLKTNLINIKWEVHESAYYRWYFNKAKSKTRLKKEKKIAFELEETFKNIRLRVNAEETKFMKYDEDEGNGRDINFEQQTT